MEDIDSSPPPTNPKKRPAPNDESPEKKPLNLKGSQFMMPTPPDTDQSSNASPICNNDVSAREVSPAPSSTTLSTVATFDDVIPDSAAQNSNTAIGLNTTASAASTSEGPPKKKRKLTFAEKEEQKREKEAKAAAKAAEKARKDAEKAAEKARKDAEKAVEQARKDDEKARKDEEKRVKDEEKRRKAEEKEAVKRENELKEERKVQAKLKDERSQMRLGAFFQKPATPAKESGTPLAEEASYNSARRKSLSLEPFDAVADQIRGSESPCKSAAQPNAVAASGTPIEPVISDYKKYFLPFQLQTHTSMSYIHRPENVEELQDAFDHDMSDPSLREKYDLGLVQSYASLERHFAHEIQSSRGMHLPSMRKLADQIQGSVQEPIDLTEDQQLINPIDALQAVPRRHIEFSQDVRPAYFGTYTKIRSPRSSRRVSRDPFRRARPDTDYDEDSEAEWEEPEEGEDLMDEDDDEAESQGDAHEMDEFLDDEDDALKNKRKLITGDLVPASTGLCWEDEFGRIVSSVEESPLRGLRGMRIGVLLANFSGTTIDPFSTAYWESEQKPAPSTSAVKVEQSGAQTGDLMPPPRPPLQSRPNSNGTLDHLFGAGGNEGQSTPAPAQDVKNVRKPTPKPLSKEDMEEFKGFVVGSQASKGELLKELKTRFPKLTNDAIKATLNDNFAQVGASKAEKKWGIVSVS